MKIAGANLGPGIRNTNNSLGEISIGQANGFEHRPRACAVGALQQWAAAPIEGMMVVRHALLTPGRIDGGTPRRVIWVVPAHSGQIPALKLHRDWARLAIANEPPLDAGDGRN